GEEGLEARPALADTAAVRRPGPHRSPRDVRRALPADAVPVARWRALRAAAAAACPAGDQAASEDDGLRSAVAAAAPARVAVLVGRDAPDRDEGAEPLAGEVAEGRHVAASVADTRTRATVHPRNLTTRTESVPLCQRCPGRGGEGVPPRSTARA